MVPPSFVCYCPRNSPFRAGRAAHRPPWFLLRPEMSAQPPSLLAPSFGNPDWLRQSVDSTSWGRVARVGQSQWKPRDDHWRSACRLDAQPSRRSQLGQLGLPWQWSTFLRWGASAERWLRFPSSVLGRKTRTPIAEMPHVRRTTWQARSRRHCHSSTTRRFPRLADWIGEVAFGLWPAGDASAAELRWLHWLRVPHRVTFFFLSIRRPHHPEVVKRWADFSSCVGSDFEVFGLSWERMSQPGLPLLPRRCMSWVSGAARILFFYL